VSRFALRPLVLLAGAYHLVLGFFMAVTPHAFYKAVAGYPPYNQHFTRDVATFYLALGAVLVIAAARRQWQVPLLVLALVQYGLHVINHIVDVEKTKPGWQGPLNAITLAVIGVALWYLLRLASRPDPPPRDRSRDVSPGAEV
jgi:hypothetical protein